MAPWIGEQLLTNKSHSVVYFGVGLAICATNVCDVVGSSHTNFSTLSFLENSVLMIT